MREQQQRGKINMVQGGIMGDCQSMATGDPVEVEEGSWEMEFHEEGFPKNRIQDEMPSLVGEEVSWSRDVKWLRMLRTMRSLRRSSKMFVGFAVVEKRIFLIRLRRGIKFCSPGQRRVGGRSLVANRWKPGHAVKIDAKSKVSVWIRLPKFPAKLWNVRMFKDIASLIGASFVGVDAYTRGLSRFGYAQILVEIPLGFSPPLEVEKEVDGGKVLRQVLEYETQIKFCGLRGSTSHFPSNCNAQKDKKTDLATSKR
ncbi:hypothetical protein EJ110_NYTH04906 [Nymphaea thermarum]|nr:hypothetical protein EJ110_NYTH04906 [Nymphaea thermarum]